MPDDSNQDQDEQRRPDRAEREPGAPSNAFGPNSLGNQPALAEQGLVGNKPGGSDAGSPPDYPDSLLRDHGLGGRGNAPVRAALVQRMQQTYGNRTTQKMLQRLKGNTASAGENDLARRIQARAGTGSALDAEVQRKLESGVGADMSEVKVHTDTEAHDLAGSVGAVAFTTGRDIFFREGTYNPETPEGLRLLAHEATHTVQQAQGPVDGTPTRGGVSVSDPSDRFEQEAEQRAEKVVSSLSTPSQASAVAAPKSSHAVQTQRTHIQIEDEGETAVAPVQRASAPSVMVQRDGPKAGAAPATKPKGKGTTTFNPVVSKTYTVKGKTLQDAVDDMSTREEAGETTWAPNLKYDLDDNGNVKSATITVTITETLPTWPGASKLNKEAKKEWDRFHTALKKHEDGHITRAKDKFKDSADRLIGKSEADAKAEFEKIKKEVQDDSDAYDAGNDHGQKEGTIIDVDAGDPKKPAAPAAPATPKAGSTSTSLDDTSDAGSNISSDPPEAVV